MVAVVPPPLPPEYGSLQVWWQQVIGAFNAILTDQQGQIDALAALNDDNILTPSEKPLWIFQHSVITGEQSDIDSKATSYGITTEKTNYDYAVSALTSHLSGLTTPVAWNNLTGNTNITGTTFRTKFNDVLTKKQLLLNKMSATAKTLADNAAADAATAQSTATTAQSTATTANSNATAAQSTANTVKRDDAIADSWVEPGTVLSATDAGSTATISIINHVRKYNDGTSVSFSSVPSITGKAYGTKYWVYYTDTSRSNTSPSFLATTNANTAVANAAAGRHFVGEITTPTAGAADTDGGFAPPSGGGAIAKFEV